MEEKNNVLLEVKNLKKYFKTNRGLLHAVDDITISIETGKTLGVVGESGCGKTTFGRVLLGLIEATDGEIIFNGRDVRKASGRSWKELRKEMQLIFQDPMASLDPRYTVFDCIAEPLKIFKVCRKKAELIERVNALMQVVGLDESMTDRFPHELDGGRRQRVGIARALALSPKFIVCDEPVSALDVSIQAQILNLLQDLQKTQNLTYVFITHDMSVVKHISDTIMVMYLGKVVELCGSKTLFQKPLHPYTKGLLAAIPIPDITVKREKVVMQGELSSPINPKPGCRFYNRCPYAKDKCRTDSPELKELLPGHYVACHFCEEINELS